MRIIFVFVLVLLNYSVSLATDYYVSTDGIELWPNCTTENSPCEASNTSKAFLGAVAGDTVYFLNGTYSGLTMRFQVDAYKEPAWFPTNSGSEGSPIVFKALNRRQAILEGLSTVAGAAVVSVIGSDDYAGMSYATWDGFVVQAVDTDGVTPTSGRVIVYGANNYVVNDCEFIGIEHSLGGGSNYEGVRFEGSDYFTVSNCDIHGWNEASDNWNTSGLKCYSSYYAEIHNNNFYDNFSHIYIKGNGNGNFKVYNNYLKDGQNGIHNTMNLEVTEHNHQYYNNLFNNVMDALGDGGVGEAVANDGMFYNNTFYNPDTSSNTVIFATADIGHGGTMYNNIIYNGAQTALMTRPGGSEMNQCDHNLYNTEFRAILSRYESERTYDSLVTWQASTELYANYDSGCGSNQNPGCGSVVGDPLFVNASGTFSEIADFELNTGSPAIGTGRSGVDMGVNISLVGVQARNTGQTKAGTGQFKSGTGSLQ